MQETNSTSRGASWIKVIVVASALLVSFVFGYIGRPGEGRAVFGTLCVFVVLIWMCRKYRKEIWFWLTVLILAAAHGFAIRCINWPNEGTTVQAVIPVIFLDFLVLYGLVRVLAKILAWKEVIQSRQK